MVEGTNRLTLDQLKEWEAEGMAPPFNRLRSMEFHRGTCTQSVGPRGGVRRRMELWRVNGALQTWKRDGGRFRLPLKNGLYAYGEMNAGNIHEFHTEAECPLNVVEVVS